MKDGKIQDIVLKKEKNQPLQGRARSGDKRGKPVTLKRLKQEKGI